MSTHLKSAKANERTTGSFTTGYAVIGNGLVTPTQRASKSHREPRGMTPRERALVEAHRTKQAACAHKRDERGLCHECWHQEAR